MTKQIPLSIIFDNSHQRISSELIAELSNDLAMRLRQIAYELEIPRIWSTEDAMTIEVQKALLRSELRYSCAGIDLASEVAKNMARTLFGVRKHTYHTLLYPMIHLSGDKAEEGVFHTDQVANLKLRTGWTAITEYDYAALSYIPFGLLVNALSSRILRVSLKPNRGLPIYAKQGETLTWGGGFYHRGNHNSSNQMSCAVVVRVTDRPLFFEPSRHTQINDISTKKLETSSFVDPSSEVNRRVQLIHALIEWANSIDYTNNNKYLCFEINQYLADHACLSDPKLSFSLSLVAQRIRTVSALFYDDSDKAKFVSFMLDLASLLCGAENLSSLQSARVSIFGRDLPIVEQLEEILSRSLVPKTQAWAIVLGRNVLAGQPVWSF